MKRHNIPINARTAPYVEAWARSPKPQNIVKPGPGQESVWDYPRPPAIEELDIVVRVSVGDTVLAESRHCLRVLETASPPTIYFPRSNVMLDALIPLPDSSFCEWKGAATYYAARVGDTFVQPAAWCYATPFEEYQLLREHVGFYAGHGLHCVYDGEVVEPQPGGFYAGWLTSNIVGPFKGAPGSKGW